MYAILLRVDLPDEVLDIPACRAIFEEVIGKEPADEHGLRWVWLTAGSYPAEHLHSDLTRLKAEAKKHGIDIGECSIDMYELNHEINSVDDIVSQPPPETVEEALARLGREWNAKNGRQ